MQHLIVIDMQNDFIDGALSNSLAQAIVPSLADYIRYAACKGVHIIFTRDTHSITSYASSKEGSFLPIHCIGGTEGWEVNKNLVDAAESMTANIDYVDKKTFAYDTWNRYIDPNDSVTLVGTCTEICVDANANALIALYPDLNISVIADLCAGLTPEGHKAALDTMKSKLIAIV